MADKGDISLIISADITSLEQGVAQATALVQKGVDTMVSAVETKLKYMAATFVAAFAFHELYDFVNGVAEARANLDKLSQSSGASVESLSAIQTVTKILGGNIDDAATAIEKLTKGLATGEGETGKAANALAALGISARNSDGSLKDGGVLYQQIASKFADLTTGAGKTALALDLFGRSGATQIPVLNALGEAGDNLVKVTGAQAEQAETYERDLRTLGIQLDANKKVIAGAMIPVLDDFVKSIMDVISGTNGITQALKEMAADGSLEQFGRDAAIVLGSIIDLAIKVGQAFKFTGTFIGAGAASMMAENAQQRAAIDAAFAEDMKTMFAAATMEDRLRKQFAGRDALKASGIDFGRGQGWTERSTYTGTGKKGPKPEDDSKALLAVQRAEAEAAANLQKEMNKEAEQANDDLYKHNLESIQDFYTKKTALEQASIQSQIDAKTQEIAAAQAGEATATTEKARLSIKAEEIKLTGQLNVLEAQYANVSVVNARAMRDAERQRADALQQVAIASNVNKGDSQIAQDRLALQQREAMNQESHADAIQEEITFENKLTAIKADAIRQQIALEAAGTNDPVKIAQMNAQIEQLELEHQQKLTQLDNEAVLERNKYALAAQQSIKDTFTTFFDDLQDRSKTLRDTFKSLWTGISKDLNDQFSKSLTERIFGAGTKGGGLLSQLTTSLFPGSAPTKSALPAPSTASPNDVAGLAALDSAAASTSTSMQGLQSGGIGGMMKGATDWIATQLTGKVATATQAATTSTASTALAAFVTAVNAATQALARMATAGAPASGAPATGGGLGGLFGKGGPSGGSTASAAQISQADSMASSASELSAQGSIPWLDGGTDFVPQDMLAMIHKGEKVTPAKFNNDNGTTGPQTFNINVPGGTSRASAAEIAQKVGLATTLAVNRNG